MTKPAGEGKPVSMSKGAAKGAQGGAKAAAGAGAATQPSRPARPRTVQLAVLALLLSALAGMAAALTLFGQTDWLASEQVELNRQTVSSAVASASASASKANTNVEAAQASASASATRDYPLSPAAERVQDEVSKHQSGAVIRAVVLVLALAMLALGVYRGRPWSRWGVIAFWFLASFIGSFAGMVFLFTVTGDTLPGPFKASTFVCAAALLAAVILVNLRSSTAWFAAGRPAGPTGMPPRRGMFTPRTPPARPAGTRGGRTTLTSSAATRGESYVQKQRAKKRATTNADAVAKGAELARSRAKASKSRRTDS